MHLYCMTGWLMYEEFMIDIHCFIKGDKLISTNQIFEKKCKERLKEVHKFYHLVGELYLPTS